MVLSLRHCFHWWGAPTHLILGVHLGHHPVFQKVKGQHLEHIQLVCHLVVDGPLCSDDMLETWLTNHIFKN